MSSTAAPQTCRRSPSPSRTQRSLPSKVKQINPRLLTYPPPRFPPTNTTARFSFINSDKTQKHKKQPPSAFLCVFHLNIAFYFSLYFEGSSLPHHHHHHRNMSVATCNTCNQSPHQRFIKVCRLCVRARCARRCVTVRYLLSSVCHVLETSLLFGMSV